MDDFELERPELPGTLISLEFGPGGRIVQLWASDPTLPEESDEFQFVLGPVSFGEEFSEDYFPGTILLGARTTPDEPWIVSRNTSAQHVDTEGDGRVRFEYEFPLLPEIRATGTFYEQAGTVPQVCWDLRIANRGRVAIEIGELAFPFALYNFMQGANRDEKSGRNPYQDRVYIHKFMGGAGSYLHAARMNNDAPGLLVFPGDATSWEMYTHVPRTLTSSYHWEGIPVVYVYSRASIEREGWSAAGQHTSLILEPGDSKLVQTRMVPTSPNMGDAVFHTLAACGRPAMRVLPAAVTPVNVGVAVEVGGVKLTRFFLSREAEIETDADDTGGFAFVRPKEPGPLRVSFEDVKGELSHASLLFTEPIDQLIRKRAQWITDHQIHDQVGHSLDQAVLLTNIRNGERLLHPDYYTVPFAIESGLADAMFLAEKNALMPDVAQIAQLDRFIFDFLRDDLQNPGDGSVGCLFADFRSVALNFSRARIYPLVIGIYEAMYRIAKFYGGTRAPADFYLAEATKTAYQMFQVAIKHESGGMPGYAVMVDLIRGLVDLDQREAAQDLHGLAMNRARDVLRAPVNDPNDLTGDTARFEELFWAARFANDASLEELAIQHAFANRDLGPDWASYASDYRIVHELEGVPTDAIADKGQLMLGGSTVANSVMFFETLRDDYNQMDDTRLRQAFGGMMGVWALVRPDGAASMGYCPDPASKHYGANPITGDIGVPLVSYLKRVRSLVLPSRAYGVFTFGCFFEVTDDGYLVQPWDGVGRRVNMRQVGCDASIDVGRITEVRLDLRKRWIRLIIENSAHVAVKGTLAVKGLWGQVAQSNGERFEAHQGIVQIPFSIEKQAKIELDIRMVG